MLDNPYHIRFTKEWRQWRKDINRLAKKGKAPCT